MTGACPCNRRCSDCLYELMCGGCLGESCIHVRQEKSDVDRTRAKCLFGEMRGLSKTCPIENQPPPREFPCANPKMLDMAIWNFNNDRDEMTKQPSDPDWSQLIPEVSDITETTSRLQPRYDDGDWCIPKFESVAWDMTGYLFDKIEGAPWVREPEILKEEDWHYILGPNEEENWIRNLILVDRLPDRLAIQTPPTAIMAAYLNRIHAYQKHLIIDEDAPQLWLLTHGYPSYIDWPPAWHWNLGIRMLSSLAEYLLSQGMGFMGPGPNALYPDSSRKTTTDLRLPFVLSDEGNRLLWKPGKSSSGFTEMDWDYFPGIIPFVPGADTIQLRWFAERIARMGFRNMALDAVNSISHENFKGLPEAISTLKLAGANHVFVYGPWPLHPPTKYILKYDVSYIPTASHMDMTNTPPRYWRKRDEPETSQDKKWEKLKSYRRTGLSEVASIDGVGTCNCKACQSAITKEIDPRSVWRWGHLLKAGLRWMKKAKTEPSEKNEFVESKLWYQGPSYTVFRKCLHYPPEVREDNIERIIDSLGFAETTLTVELDKLITSSENIHWTWWDEMHEWSKNFPKLED